MTLNFGVVYLLIATNVSVIYKNYIFGGNLCLLLGLGLHIIIF